MLRRLRQLPPWWETYIVMAVLFVYGVPHLIRLLVAS